MGILDNLEASLDLLWDDSLDKPAFDDSDLELQTQNPHITD
jgi:hypothetical protein